MFFISFLLLAFKFHVVFALFSLQHRNDTLSWGALPHAFISFGVRFCAQHHFQLVFNVTLDSALEMPSDAVIDGGLVRGLPFLSAAARPHMLFLLPPNSFPRSSLMGTSSPK